MLTPLATRGSNSSFLISAILYSHILATAEKSPQNQLLSTSVNYIEGGAGSVLLSVFLVTIKVSFPSASVLE